MTATRVFMLPVKHVLTLVVLAASGAAIETRAEPAAVYEPCGGTNNPDTPCTSGLKCCALNTFVRGVCQLCQQTCRFAATADTTLETLDPHHSTPFAFLKMTAAHSTRATLMMAALLWPLSSVPPRAYASLKCAECSALVVGTTWVLLQASDCVQQVTVEPSATQPMEQPKDTYGATTDILDLPIKCGVGLCGTGNPDAANSNPDAANSGTTDGEI